ncbi:MAG: DUF1043 family protein [Halomonas sp.]|nr:DUF1043 family protein [Halomonas sp.]TVP42483.1 MAG: DUF1043 family protein [Halomonas sp.]
MDPSSSLVFAVIGLIVGFIAGMGCYRLFSKSQRQAAAMRQTLLEREHQIAEIKNSVGDHLTGIYQRLNNIRNEADQLELQLREDAAAWNIRDVSAQSNLDLSGIQAKKDQPSSANSIAPPFTPTIPRDYADGEGGTLSEDFGLKDNEATTPQPPRY